MGLLLPITGLRVYLWNTCFWKQQCTDRSAGSLSTRRAGLGFSGLTHLHCEQRPWVLRPACWYEASSCLCSTVITLPSLCHPLHFPFGFLRLWCLAASVDLEVVQAQRCQGLFPRTEIRSSGWRWTLISSHDFSVLFSLSDNKLSAMLMTSGFYLSYSYFLGSSLGPGP